MSFPNSAEINYVRCIKCGVILKCSRYDVAVLLEHIKNDHREIDIVDTDTKQKRHFFTQPTKTTTATYDGQEHSIEDCHCSDEECIARKCQQNETQSFKQSQNAKDTVDLSHYSATSEVLAKYPEIKECEYAAHNPNAQVAYTRRYKLSTPSPMSVSVLNQPFQHTLYRTSIEKWCPANGSIYCPKCASHKRPLIKTKAERFTYNECGACCLLSCWPFCFIPWILPGQNHEYLFCANCKTFLGRYDRHTNSLRPNRLYVSSGIRPADKPKEPNKIKWNRIKENKMLDNESPPVPPSSVTDSAKSKRLASIIVNGQELSPDTVARIQKYKRFSSLVGIDLDALTNDTPSATNLHVADNENETTAAAKENKASTAKF